MNGFEQPKFEPPPQPETAQQKWEREQREAEKIGQEIQERRAQREGEAAAKEYPRYGSRTLERIQRIEREMAEERKAAGLAEEAEPPKPAAVPAEASPEALPEKAVQPAEKKAETAEQTREATREEIARHLVERPGEALDIFKKGVGLKLEKAAIGFTSFWKRAGAEALRVASRPVEKVVGGSMGKVSEKVWATQEYLLTRPGAKRLEKVLAIQANIKSLEKAGAITKDQANDLLEDIMKQYHDASSDVLVEDRAHRDWEERKKKTLGAMETFGHLGEKLSKWGKRQKAEAVGKKESAKQKRAGKIAEKF